MQTAQKIETPAEAEAAAVVTTPEQAEPAAPAAEATQEANVVDLNDFKKSEAQAAGFTADEQATIASVSRVIDMIAKGDATHAAVATPAAKHTEVEIKQVFGYIGKVPGDGGLTAERAVELLQAAKDALAAEYAANPKPAAEEGGDQSGAPATAAEPKKGKAKGEKKPKAEKKPKEPAAEKADEPVVKVDLVAVPVGALTIAERAKLVDLFETVYLEADPTGVTPKGHQIDPFRREGFDPAMPSKGVFASTGNPYPAECDATVQTGDKYKRLVAVQHHTYAQLVERKEIRANDDAALAAVLEAAGEPDDRATRACFRDTLRDLAMVGLAELHKQGRTAIFRLPAAE